MAEIRAFRGLRYSPQVVPDLAPVLCPPYDVLSPEEQRGYHQHSAYNIVRLEQGLEAAEPSPSADKYERSAAILREWQEQGVLKLEPQPALYVHRHRFAYRGRTYQRQALIARLRLEERGSRVVRPHEGTLAAPKDDRLRLLRACRANISPIFVLYDDPEQHIASLLAAVEKGPPLAVASESQGEGHTLWAIPQPQAIAELQGTIRSLPLYIADGHHRYETALAFRMEALRLHPGSTGEEAFNFVMAALVNTADPGLLILPVHRLVRGLSLGARAALPDRLRTIFEVRAYRLGGGDSLEVLLAQMRARGGEGTALGLYGLDRENFYLLTRQEAIPAALVPPGTSPLHRRLEAAVLRHGVLEGMLGIKEGGDGLAYTPQAEEAKARVDAGEYQLAFFLNPLPVEQLKAVADAGETLPGKSTYFYPKLPTGLVLYPLEQGD